MWVQNMEVFLRGRNLWRYVSRDIAIPTKLEGEKEDKFFGCLEDWESINYKILSWLINTLVHSQSASQAWGCKNSLGLFGRAIQLYS